VRPGFTVKLLHLSAVLEASPEVMFLAGWIHPGSSGAIYFILYSNASKAPPRVCFPRRQRETLSLLCVEEGVSEEGFQS